MTLIRTMTRLAGIGGLCLLSLAARAELPANGAGYMDASFAAVVSLTQGTGGKARLPRLADPVEGKVLDDVWNVKAILGSGPYIGSDIPALIGILQKQAQLVTLYTQFSPGGSAKPNPAANEREYQDELTRTHEFVLKAVAAALQAMNSFGASLTQDEKTEQRFQGLRQMRAGLLGLVTSAAGALNNPGMRPDNQLRLAKGFSENAAALAAGFAPADRKTLLTALQAASLALKPDAQKAVGDFVKTVSAAACNGLCRLD